MHCPHRDSISPSLSLSLCLSVSAGVCVSLYGTPCGGVRAQALGDYSHNEPSSSVQTVIPHRDWLYYEVIIQPQRCSVSSLNVTKGALHTKSDDEDIYMDEMKPRYSGGKLICEILGVYLPRAVFSHTDSYFILSPVWIFAKFRNKLLIFQWFFMHFHLSSYFHISLSHIERHYGMYYISAI